MMIFLREKFIAQLFMWVIAIVFVVGSILLYSGSSGQGGDGSEEEVVVKIGALEISRGNFERGIADEIKRRQEQPYRGDPDEKVVQKEIIEELIKRSIEGSAEITDAEIERYIRSDESRVQQYNQYVGFGVPELYLQTIRQNLSSTALKDNIEGLELVTDTEAEQAYRLETDKAIVKFIEFRHTDYVSTVNIDDTEAEKYFQEHQDIYKTEEQVNVKFIQINPEYFVSQSDLETYYTENQKEFTTPEAVKARHILKKFPDNATDEQKAETKTAAEELLKTVNAELESGTTFADLAKTHSEGPSGANGGALRGGNTNLPPGDYFARGDMVKPFEEAAFDILKPGEVSDLVETSYGFHIITLEEKLAGQVKAFPDVESEIHDKVVKISGVNSAKKIADDLLFDIEVENYEAAIGLDTYKDLLLNVQETGFFSKDDDNIPKIGSKSIHRGLIDELFNMEVGVIKTIETKNFAGDVTAFFVATILDKKPSGIPQFNDDIKAEVVDDLREKKSKDLAFTDAQNLFNQNTDNELLDDLIKKYKAPEGITADNKTVQESTQFNLSPRSTYVPGMGYARSVMLAAFNMSVGEVNGPFTADNSTYIIELTEREEPDLELYRMDPTQKKQRYSTLLQTKKQEAYANWLAVRKKTSNLWIHEDYN